MIPVGMVTTKSRNATREDSIVQLSMSDSTAKIILFEDARPGLFENHRAAWSGLFARAPRALLLQDDIHGCKNWYQAICYVAEKRPNLPVLAFFNPFYSEDDNAREWGFSKRKTFWEQALLLQEFFWVGAMRTFDRSEERREAIRMSKRPTDFHHDLALRTHAEDIRCPTISIFPPIFQHLDLDSTVGNPMNYKGVGRVSADWPGPDFDALEYVRKKFQ